MNPDAYIEMAKTEDTHWWFSGRRKILSKIISNLKLPENAKILEIGCGTGGNLHMLSRYGELSALEMDSNASAIAAKKTNNSCTIYSGRFPDKINFQGKHFDLICLFDVLEHIEQDNEALIALKDLLSPKGHILITVPAHQWLWGQHDEFLHHQRRYSCSELNKKISAAGLQSVKTSYFNSILFLLVVMIRLKDKLFNKDKASGTSVPFAPLNSLLKFIFSTEALFLSRFNIPFGVSLLCLLKKL